MDKRSILAIGLSVLVLVGWQLLVVPRFRPKTVPPAAAPVTEPDAAAGGAASAPEQEPAGAPAPPAPPVPIEGVAAEAPREFILETATYSIRFSNRGGRILSWRLLKYLDDLKAPLEVVPRDLEGAADFPLRVTLRESEEDSKALDAALYKDEVRDASSQDTWAGEGFRGKIVAFRFSDGRGLSVTKRLAIPDDGYVGRLQIEAARAGRPADFLLTWAVGLPEPPGDGTTRYFHAEGQGVVWIANEARRYSVHGATQPVAITAAPGAGALLWGGLESTYFASLLLPERTDAGSLTFAPVALPSPADPKNAAHLAARFAPPAGPASFMVMVGPKDYDLLVGLDRELDHAIDFSRYSIIYVLTKYLFIALRWVNSYIGNYGLSIVILTILIRAGFFPLTYRSAITMRQNMKKMQRIQPKVKAIQERYKKTKRTMDTQRQMNDEIMALYRKENMNPMGSLGGCLPMLLQMPVFIAFYNLLSVTIELRGAPFVGWIHDLSRMDPYYIWPILMGASWMVQQWMTSSSIPDPMQRRMMGMMPLIFTFMMAHMPSGLVIYWFISNVVGLGQQWLINRHADRMPAQAG